MKNERFRSSRSIEIYQKFTKSHPKSIKKGPEATLFTPVIQTKLLMKIVKSTIATFTMNPAAEMNILPSARFFSKNAISTLNEKTPARIKHLPIWDRFLIAFFPRFFRAWRFWPPFWDLKIAHQFNKGVPGSLLGSKS